MSTNDKDWFVELGLTRDQEKIMDWGMETYPHFSKNKNLIAQLWYTQVLGKVLPTPQTIVSVEDLRKKAKEFADAGELKTADGKDKRVWGSIEVLMVGPLGDGRPYFGCPKCLRGVDKNIGVCINETAHPGEQIDGQNLTWQNWQAGDSTGEIIVTFAPNKKQSPHSIQGSILVLSGSLSLRDGRYTVWEVIKSKSMGKQMATSLKATAKEVVPAVEEMEVPEIEDFPEVEEPEIEEIGEELGEIIVDQITEPSDEESFEEPEEEDFGAELLEGLEDMGEGSGEVNIDALDGFDAMTKRFKNALKRYVGKKTVKSEVMVNWLLVQPQLRGKAVDEQNELAKQFLDKMVELDYISLSGDTLVSKVGV